MPKEPGVAVVDYFPADVAWVPRSPLMRSFTGGHPEERYRSWDSQVPFFECARLRAVRIGGLCGCSFPGTAVCQCVWLVAGLRWLVMDEKFVIHTVVVGGLFCFLWVQLDVVLQLCICPLDGGELHMTYCGFRSRGVVGDDPVELEWYRFREHRFLDFRLPHQAPDFICQRRGQAPSGVLCYRVLPFPRGQVVASLSQRALFEVFPRLWLLEVAGAYGVFWGYAYTPSVIQVCTLSRRGSCSSSSWARRARRCTGIRDGSGAEKYNTVSSSCWRRFIRVLPAWLPRMCATVRMGRR